MGVAASTALKGGRDITPRLINKLFLERTYLYMKIQDYFKDNKSDNKYDVAIRMCYLIFLSIGFIVFFSVGLQYMRLWVWLLSFVCCTLGAVIYGTVAKIIITMIRKDLQSEKKIKTELILKLSYLIIFSFAVIIFVATGLEKGTAKSWIISFVGSFGGAVIYSAITRIIVTFIRKDK